MNVSLMDKKLKNSFHAVMNDMIALENGQRELLRRVERMERMLMRSAVQQRSTEKTVYIGNVETREVHAPDCILARGMDGKNQMAFLSRHGARQAGFSECICLQ